MRLRLTCSRRAFSRENRKDCVTHRWPPDVTLDAACIRLVASALGQERIFPKILNTTISYSMTRSARYREERLECLLGESSRVHQQLFILHRFQTT